MFIYVGSFKNRVIKQVNCKSSKKTTSQGSSNEICHTVFLKALYVAWQEPQRKRAGVMGLEKTPSTPMKRIIVEMKPLCAT